MIGFLDEFEANNKEPEKRFIVKRVVRRGYKWFIIDKLHNVAPQYSTEVSDEIRNEKIRTIQKG